MRRVDQNWTGRHVVVSARNAWRRADWFTRGLSPSQVANTARAAVAFARHQERLRSWPVLVKVDISPVCNLHCTYCVHASPESDPTGTLAEQRFSSAQRMALADFERLVAEMAGRTAMVALYYVGDPLVHPQLADFCAAAARAGLNSHVSTNLSFHLPDARLERLVTSGLSHLTVCVDSMRQDRYELTRVGGDIGLVLRNLERILELRHAAGGRAPRVEVQFIKYQHNADEVDDAAAWCEQRGVDQFTEYWGNLHNYVDLDPARFDPGDAVPGGLLPRCAWPWFAMQVRYDGGAIPCCYHRVSEQYRAGGDSRTVGNVVTDGLFDVWNSEPYRRIRRVATDPAASTGGSKVSGTFCDGCPAVFRTGAAGAVLTADAHRWEDVYFRSPAGAVTRRREP